MRKGNEVIEQVLQVAKQMEEIRAVIRTNFVPVREYLHSYEFYFIVKDVAVFDNDEIFEKNLGKRILLYRGDRNYPEFFPEIKGHLMVFEDGVTVVINAISKASFMKRFEENGSHGNVWIGNTYLKLMDKDDSLPPIDKTKEVLQFFTERPTKENYLGTCAEFFWVLKTLAEYICRKELLAAMFYLNVSVRDMLNRMLRWYISMENDFSVEIGILDSYMEKLLPTDFFELYKKTYPIADYASIWDSLHAAVALFHKAGSAIAERFEFEYPDKMEKDIVTLIQNLER